MSRVSLFLVLGLLSSLCGGGGGGNICDDGFSPHQAPWWLRRPIDSLSYSSLERAAIVEVGIPYSSSSTVAMEWCDGVSARWWMRSLWSGGGSQSIVGLFAIPSFVGTGGFGEDGGARSVCCFGVPVAMAVTAAAVVSAELVVPADVNVRRRVVVPYGCRRVGCDDGFRGWCRCCQRVTAAGTDLQPWQAWARVWVSGPGPWLIFERVGFLAALLLGSGRSETLVQAFGASGSNFVIKFCAGSGIGSVLQLLGHGDAPTGDTIA